MYAFANNEWQWWWMVVHVTCTDGRGGGGRGGQGQSTPKPLYTASYTGTSIQRSAKGLGKFACYIEGLLYWKPQFQEFLSKQAKRLLYRGMVND